uniref:Polymeric immunoglobulin receptor n=1 Tax=Nothoprocta perdicaria TaxID=30464 RepID=A0A8C6Z544_NOTPE
MVGGRQVLMVPLLCAAGRAPGPAQLVRGPRGGSVAVHCPPGGHAGPAWCKLGRGGCALVADGRGYVQGRYEGRVALGAPGSNGTFTVLMNDLRMEDAGTYACGATVPQGGPGTVELWVTAGRKEGAADFQEIYVCRWSAGRCRRLLDSSGFVHGSYEGRARLGHRDAERGTFTVLLRRLREDDAGWYWCAPGTRSSLLAVLNPIFGPREVSGLLDGSVTVKCFYPQTTVNKHDRKYWCREATRSCHTVVSSNGYVAPGYQGRVAITDFPDQGVFLVNVSGLGLADRGSYHCGLGLNNRALSFQVKLDVSEGSGCRASKRARGSRALLRGDYASIRKYLCKMEKSGCRNIIDTYGKVDDEYAGRILLSNENTAGSYSIMITQLGWQDAGLYLCGAGVYGESGETKEVDLHVYEGQGALPQGLKTPTWVPFISGRSSLKYWCKWRKNGSASPSCSAGPSSLVLALVSVGGVFLILATVFAVYKYRQMKRSGESVPLAGDVGKVGVVGGVEQHIPAAPAVGSTRSLARAGGKEPGGRSRGDRSSPVPHVPALRPADLVSVGSYRTNISMSDFESAKEYGANDNACMKGTQETQIGGDGKSRGGPAGAEPLGEAAETLPNVPLSFQSS